MFLIEFGFANPIENLWTAKGHTESRLEIIIADLFMVTLSKVNQLDHHSFSDNNVRRF
jgi:hypothetical protein